MTKILIVDDDESDRKHLRRELSHSGAPFDCTDATNLEGAVTACESNVFDCALVDYKMPGEYGLEGISALHARFPHMAIIMVTGYGDEMVATEAMKCGASDYIPKAMIRSELIKGVILSAVAKAEQRREAALHREEVLRQFAEREQLLIAAVASSNDAIVTKSIDGVITGWNQAAQTLFGFTAEEAIGRNIDIIVPGDLRALVRENEDRIRRGEKIDHHETVRTNKDGRRIDVSLSVSPILSPIGSTIGAATVARDITAKKQVTQALFESERMARGIIDTALDAFVQMNDGGDIIDWNPQAEAVFGWSRVEAIGRNLGDLIVPENLRERHNGGLALFLRGGKGQLLGQRLQTEAQHRSGRRLNVELSVTALRRESGCVFNGFIRDITQSIAAEAQFRHAQKMEAVGQLTGGIAHDFNNMLTVIAGTIEILAEAVSERPDLVDIAKLIVQAADRGAELTHQLLAFARKQPLQPQDVAINDLVRESARLMRPTLGEQIEIKCLLGDDIWPAFVDRGQLSTALLNLAINARDAMPGGGSLMLETHNVVFDEGDAGFGDDMRPGNYVMIAISDTGVGIPREIREKIFEPFFTTKAIGKGTGLGLSMVYGFVKQSRGHIKLSSDEGLGSTFRIYLPRAAVDHSAKPIEIEPAARVVGGNETILVVEDEALVRAHVTNLLHDLGYRTLSAANAADALLIVEGGAKYDLLFTDVIMPGLMNGSQLAEALAERGATSKVLFTSGNPENAIVHDGRVDPGVLLLAKPYRRADLARMLRLALDAASTPRYDRGDACASPLEALEPWSADRKGLVAGEARK